MKLMRWMRRRGKGMGRRGRGGVWMSWGSRRWKLLGLWLRWKGVLDLGMGMCYIAEALNISLGRENG